MSTKTFQYVVPEEYFPAHKIIRPFSISVYYQVLDGHPLIMSLEMSPVLLQNASGFPSMVQDIERAVKLMIEKNKYATV